MSTGCWCFPAPCRVGHRLGDAGFEACDRFLQHLLIELEPNLLDVAGLLFAQQIAGAADVEIVRGELKSGAQGVERLQDFEPPFRLKRDAAGRQR